LFDGGVGAITETFPTDTGEPFADLPATQDPALTVPIPERAAGIARRYGCEPEREAAMIATAVEHIEYSCPADADVMLILAHGAGHVWPGDTLTPGQEAYQGPGTIEIDATEMMWEFFEQHPMPEKQVQGRAARWPDRGADPLPTKPYLCWASVKGSDPKPARRLTALRYRAP